MNIIMAIVSCLALGASFPALADWRVDQRPNTLSTSKELVYRYQTAKGEIETPTTGINSRVGKIHENLKAWVTNFAALKVEIESSSIGDLPGLEGRLATKALNQAKALDIIYSDALELAVRLNVLSDSLTSVQRLNYSLETYQTEYTSLTQAIDNLASNLSASEDRLRDLLSDIRNAIPSINRALLSRLKITLINQGISNWETIVAQMDSLFKTDEEMDRLTKPFKADFRRFNRYFLEGRFFTVSDLGTDLQKSCNDIKLAINNYQGNDKVKSSYLAGMNSACTTIKSNTDFYTSKKAGDVVASGIHDLRLKRLKNRCMQPNPGFARCEMFLWLGKLTREQISAMDPNTLRGLEMLWAEAEGEGFPK